MATPRETIQKPGPTSRADRLARLDGRTREGKIIAKVMAALISDLGGEAMITAGERLLIRSAAIKSLRIELLAEQMIVGEETNADPHHLVSWSNSLRNDLTALGLKRRARELGVPGQRKPSSIREKALAAPIEAVAA